MTHPRPSDFAAAISMRPHQWIAIGVALVTTILAPPSVFALSPAAPLPGEPLVAWPFFQSVLPPDRTPASDSPWSDFVLSPVVFDKARFDLADLRLYDRAGREIPYALRVRRPEDRRDAVQAKVFNRARGPEGSAELSLDLGAGSAEHNEIEIQMPAVDFRRRSVLEGSDDADQWRELAADNLLRFQAEKGLFQDVSLTYPPSRFRYLRLRVYQDPLTDKDPPQVDGAAVYRTVTMPGEMLTLPGALGPREATRASSAPASAWIIELGGENVPVEQIAVEIDDDDFVRDYHIEAAGPEGSREPFRQIHAGTWRRRAGEERRPLKAEHSEVRAARLRLVVIDHGNPPLDVRSVSFSAPVRQVVFAQPEEPAAGYRLYYGNRDARAPFYDFARNLPEVLEPPPVRAQLEDPQPNPAYLPKPLPLTERWPWLIYAVLGSVSLVLAGVVLRVARRAIAVYDAQDSQQPACCGQVK
ncbi:MAG: DUF3999 domain-containing protein [Rhodopirellula sp.]|nr:DUF3999 domain-containing protein [Rhodopirellula sp.]